MDMSEAAKVRNSGSPDSQVSMFLMERARIFGIAYRMLGSATEAEDVVQESWLRWAASNHEEIREPAAFLTTTATRLCLNILRSARVRRETYIGPWLPEPLNTSGDSTLGAERGEALSFAVMILLERLTPTERAAYILREAFEYPYAEIGRVVRMSEAATRQLVSRARKKVRVDAAAVAPTEHNELLTAFLHAAQHGDLVALEKLLTADVVSVTDGGGVRQAARVPVVGRHRVAKFVASFSGHFWVGKTISWVELNGQASVVLDTSGEVSSALTITSTDRGISQILWILNPSKLNHVRAR